MYENLLSRDPKTGDLSPLLAERWEVLDGGRAWRIPLWGWGQEWGNGP
jgi:ABC-type transport system substrate-binding protein